MAAVIRIGEVDLSSAVESGASALTAPVTLAATEHNDYSDAAGLTAPVTLAGTASVLSTTNISVAATPVALTVTSPATAVTIAIFSLASGAMAAGITADMSAIPSGISPPASAATYAPIIVAVRVTGTIQCLPPPLAPPSTWQEPPRLLPIVVVDMPTPAIVNGQPCLPTYWGQTSSTVEVT